MGLFRLVARVGCLRGGATRLLEEWPPSHARESAMDRTRLTGPLANYFVVASAAKQSMAFAGLLRRRAPRNDGKEGCRWRSTRDRTIGVSRAGAPTATRAVAPRAFACVIATVATR